MSFPIEPEQRATVSHRTGFWGQPTGGGAAWDYHKGVPLLIKRPAGGDPPRSRSVQCRHCRKVLRYKVHSVEATRHRQRMWRILAALGLALFVVGAAGLFAMFSNDDSVVLGVATATTFIGGGALAGFCLQEVDEEIGVTGHFAWYPGPTRHKVTIEVEVEKPQLSHLVCQRCGHRERFWVASARPEAEERMRGHICL